MTDEPSETQAQPQPPDDVLAVLLSNNPSVRSVCLTRSDFNRAVGLPLEHSYHNPYYHYPDDKLVMSFFVDFFHALDGNRHVSRFEIASTLMLMLRPRPHLEFFMERLSKRANLEEFIVWQDQQIPVDAVDDDELPINLVNYSVITPLFTNARNLSVFHMNGVHVDVTPPNSSLTAIQVGEALRKRRKTLKSVALTMTQIYEGGVEIHLDPLFEKLHSMRCLKELQLSLLSPVVGTTKNVTQVAALPKLESLTLKYILDDAVMGSLTEALKHHPTLREIDVRDHFSHQLTSTSHQLLLDLVKNNCRITSVRVREEFQYVKTAKELLEMFGNDCFTGDTEGCKLRKTDVLQNIDIWTMFNKVGRSQLMKPETSSASCVEVLAKASDDLDVLFLALSTRPDICNLEAKEHEQVCLRGRIQKLGEEKALTKQWMDQLAKRLFVLEEQSESAQRELSELKRQGEPPAKRQKWSLWGHFFGK